MGQHEKKAQAFQVVILSGEGAVLGPWGGVEANLCLHLHGQKLESTKGPYFKAAGRLSLSLQTVV